MSLLLKYSAEATVFWDNSVPDSESLDNFFASIYDYSIKNFEWETDTRMRIVAFLLKRCI